MRKCFACQGFSPPAEHHLQPRIDDVWNGCVGVGIPITASLSDCVRDDSLRNLVRSLHDIDVQPSRHVPCDVAMERPHTWVVRDELNDNVARGAGHGALNQLHITSLGVGLMDNGAVPCAHTFGQNVEIMTVQMHRMRGSALVFDDDSDARVGTKVVDVPLRIVGIRGISPVGEQEDWVVHVPAEGLVVHLPENVAGRVGADGDSNLLRGGWCGRGWEREEWSGLVKRVVGTFAIIDRRGHRRGGLGGIGAVVVNGGQSQRLGAIGAFADE